MLNEVRLIGHVGRDPEIRTMPNGDKVASFSIATSERWKDRETGEKKEHTEWHNVVVFGPLVKVVEDYVKKGGQIFVGGQLRTRKWQDNSGNDRWSTEVVLRGFDARLQLLGKADGGGAGRHDYSSHAQGLGSGSGSGPGASGGVASSSGGGAAGGGFDPGLDDDVPF